MSSNSTPRSGRIVLSDHFSNGLTAPPPDSWSQHASTESFYGSGPRSSRLHCATTTSPIGTPGNETWLPGQMFHTPDQVTAPQEHAQELEGFKTVVASEFVRITTEFNSIKP